MSTPLFQTKRGEAVFAACSRARPLKGRGALSNRSGRCQAWAREAFDDEWSGGQPRPAPRTTLTPDTCRTVISYNDSPDVPFDRSVNPYRGCEHGCAYCYARPTHAWLGLSPGLDFETNLFVKPRAAEQVQRELAQPNYRCAPLTLGAITDPYQPVERDQKVTRSVLEVLAANAHPVCIVTKSALVERDIDILSPMANRRHATVARAGPG